MPGLWFQFHFQEHDLGRGLVEHVMFHPGLAEVGFTEAKLRLERSPPGATMVISPEVTGTMT